MVGKREGMDIGKIMYLCVVTLLCGARLPILKHFAAAVTQNMTEGCGKKSLCAKACVGYNAVGSVVIVFSILNLKVYILRGVLKRL